MMSELEFDAILSLHGPLPICAQEKLKFGQASTKENFCYRFENVFSLSEFLLQL